MHLVLLLSTLHLCIFPTLARLFTLYNNCPQTIKLYINGESQGSLGVRTTTTRNLPKDWSGVIYSDINGGSATGEKTTRAGFYGMENYYYIIVESRLNTGISIEPQAPIDNGFCVRNMCDNKACTSIYHQPPTNFPSPSQAPPTPPLYACTAADVGYKVTFCPSGGFPPPRNSEPVPIHHNNDLLECLDVRGVANGTAVEIAPCNNSNSQKWLISAGLTLINSFGSGLCVDAGKAPGSGARLTLQYCTYEPPDSQSWDYTEGRQLQLYKTGNCLSYSKESSRTVPVITSDCIARDTSQVWSFP